MIYLFEDYSGEDWSANDYMKYIDCFGSIEDLEKRLMMGDLSAYEDYRIMENGNWRDVKLKQHYKKVTSIKDKIITDAYGNEHTIPTEVTNNEKDYITVEYS